MRTAAARANRTDRIPGLYEDAAIRLPNLLPTRCCLLFGWHVPKRSVGRAQGGEGRGRVVRQAFGTVFDTQFKSDANPVTDIDHAAEEHVLNVISHHFPEDSVLAEEAAGVPGKRAGSGWSIHWTEPSTSSMPFPTSRCRWPCGATAAPAAAAVIDVMRGEELTASKGGGAFSGSNPMAVSTQVELSHGLIATGFAYDRNVHGRAYAENMGQVLTRVQGIRRLGSSALDFGWVAAGRYEGLLGIRAVTVGRRGGDPVGDRSRWAGHQPSG